MVKVTFTNNAGSVEKIVDETKCVQDIIAEVEFSHPGADVVVNGVAVPLDAPLAAFLPSGAVTARISAVAHKANA